MQWTKHLQEGKIQTSNPNIQEGKGKSDEDMEIYDVKVEAAMCFSHSA
jgi:hypothetical protein